MTLRLPDQLATELREVADQDRRSVHQTVILAVEAWLAARETAEIAADPRAMRAILQAQAEVDRGEVSTTTDVLADLAKRRRRPA